MKKLFKLIFCLLTAFPATSLLSGEKKDIIILAFGMVLISPYCSEYDSTVAKFKNIGFEHRPGDNDSFYEVWAITLTAKPSLPTTTFRDTAESDSPRPSTPLPLSPTKSEVSLFQARESGRNTPIDSLKTIESVDEEHFFDCLDEEEFLTRYENELRWESYDNDVNF